MSLWSMALFCTLSLLPDMKDGQIIFQKSQITENGTVWGRETRLCTCPAHGTGRERGGPRPLGSSGNFVAARECCIAGQQDPQPSSPKYWWYPWSKMNRSICIWIFRPFQCTVSDNNMCATTLKYTIHDKRGNFGFDILRPYLSESFRYWGS